LASKAVTLSVCCTGQDQLSGLMSKRDMCAKELLETEKNYTEVLQMIVEVSLSFLLTIISGYIMYKYAAINPRRPSRSLDEEED